MLTPRPYQVEAKTAAYRAIRKHRSALVAMPTGTGKGALIGMIIADAVRAKKRVLAMVHRKEIVDQLADHVRRWAGHEPAIERAEMRQADDGSLVVVGSVPSLVGRLDRFAPDGFDLVIADECFPAGTAVLTPSGNRPIQDLREGDCVYTFKDDTYVVPGRVTDIFESRPAALVRVLFTNGKSIACTPGHPFYDVDASAYVQAAAMRVGQRCLAMTERASWDQGHYVAAVEPIEPTADGTFGGVLPDGKVYNIEVQRTHNYFANGVLVHNCHHALARSWRSVRDHFTTAKCLGFTATPNRGDERALAQVFDDVAYDMTIADAVLDGWLVPFRTVEIKLRSLDLSAVRRRSGELMAGDLGAVMSETAVLREAIEPAVEMAGDKQAIVFTATIAHMHAVAETARTVLRERRMPAVVATVDGTTPRDERDRIFAAFRAREINWLINVEVATEGFDAPSVEAVIMLRPTLSQALYTQMIGRGGRPLPGLVDGLAVEDMLVRHDLAMATGDLDPEGWTIRAIQAVHRGDVAAARRLAIALSPKPECLVLDFAANTSRHQVASVRDLLGGDYTLPDQAAAQRMLAAGSAAHLLDALERAKAMRLAKMREAMARAGDPFALFDLSPRADRYGRAPTAKQQRWIERLQLPRASIDVAQANALLRELSRREDLDLCLYSQAALLARLGHPIRDIPGLSRAQASMMIRALSADHWRRPSDWQGMRERSAR